MENGSAEPVNLLSFMTGNVDTVKASALPTFLIAIAITWFIGSIVFRKRKNLPPAILGGKPFLGNVLQLRNTRPHYLFTDWAQKYGPIFRLKAGTKNIVVCSSPELFKEVTVTKFESISKRKLPKSFGYLADGFIAMSDYTPHYISEKKHFFTHLLGPAPQKAQRPIREEEITKMLDLMFQDVPSGEKEVNMRVVVRNMLFDFTMRQIFGFTFEGVQIPELGYLSKQQVSHTLIYEILSAATETDWRDFWPFFSWVPNKSLHTMLEETVRRRDLILLELINMYKKNSSLIGSTGCYCDVIFEENHFPTQNELISGVYEPIIEGSDTSSITCEWIMFELAKSPEVQERLYKEIKSVVGDRMMNEDDIPHLPLMEAIIKETLRKHPPLGVMPPRLVEEDITIGGYDIPKGWEIMLNVWGIGLDKKAWSDADVWNPDRCLNQPKLDMGFQNFRIAPFGGGKRRCIGIAQATAIISLFVGTLVQHFEFKLAPSELLNPTGEDEGLATITTYKATPFQAVVKPRVSKLLPKRA